MLLKEKKSKGISGRRSASEQKKTNTKRAGIQIIRSLKKLSKKESPTKTKHTGLSEKNYQNVDPSTRWIIVELTEESSLEIHYEQIVHSLEEVLGLDVASFIPMYHEKVQGKNACFVLFEGYIFILRTESTVSNIFKLRSDVIKGPLFVDGCMRLVTGTRINEYKQKLQEKLKTLIPEEGQEVIPRIGVFKNMEGTVLSVDKKKLIAIVRFEKSSRVVEAPINVVNLLIISRFETATRNLSKSEEIC